MPQLQALVGVYDARSNLTAEVAYWVGARLGRRHCALCDITHGTFRERPEWKACRAGLPVPFTTLHLDERDPDLVALTDGSTPCVVARTDAGDVVLLGPTELEACDGDTDRLMAAIEAQVVARGLSWPAAAVVPPE